MFLNMSVCQLLLCLAVICPVTSTSPEFDEDFIVDLVPTIPAHYYRTVKTTDSKEGSEIENLRSTSVPGIEPGSDQEETTGQKIHKAVLITLAVVALAGVGACIVYGCRRLLRGRRTAEGRETTGSDNARSHDLAPKDDEETTQEPTD